MKKGKEINAKHQIIEISSLCTGKNCHVSRLPTTAGRAGFWNQQKPDGAPEGQCYSFAISPTYTAVRVPQMRHASGRHEAACSSCC